MNKGIVELPFNVDFFVSNADHVLLTVGEYLYLVNISNEAASISLEFSFALVKKNCPDDFYPVVIDKEMMLVRVDAGGAGLQELKKLKNSKLICYKESAGPESITISMIKSTNNYGEYERVDHPFKVTFENGAYSLKAHESEILSQDRHPNLIDRKPHNPDDEPKDDPDSSPDSGDDDDNPKDNKEDNPDSGKSSVDDVDDDDNDKDSKEKKMKESESISLEGLNDWVVVGGVAAMLICCFGFMIFIICKFIRSEMQSDSDEIKHAPLPETNDDDSRQDDIQRHPESHMDDLDHEEV